MYPTRSFRLLEYHGNMLSDAPRVSAYARALEKKVQPGLRVLDLGTGSGLLALLAARAGAGRVDAVEIAEVVELARELVERNGLGSVVRVHQSLSYHLHLPQPADLLVTETLGNFGLEEGILGSVIDARMRLLTPRADLIPERVRLFATPITLAAEHRKVSVWSSTVRGIDLSAVGRRAANLLWYVRYNPDDELGPTVSLGEVDLRHCSEARFSGRATMSIERQGLLHGVGGTFEAELAPGVSVGNAPGDGAPSWRQAFLPLESPWAVHPGDRIEVAIDTWDNGEHWRWDLQCGARTARLSTEAGYRSSLSGVY